MFVEHKFATFAKGTVYNDMKTTLLSIAMTLIVLAVLYLGGWEWIGSKAVRLLPQATLQKGDKAVIFLNGRYNRTATISKVVADGVYLYDGRIKLPLDYRGRFYGWGVDTNDGSRLVFLKYRKHYRLVRLAEYIRRCFGVIEDEDNLVPDCADIPTDNGESEVSGEK